MGDQHDRSERERPSWSEIDRRRDGRASSEPRPQGPAARERAARATKQYLHQADQLFAHSKGGAEVEVLAKAVREAHGTPKLAQACRAYRDVAGIPADPALLSTFLDSDDGELMREVLEAMLNTLEAGRLAVNASQRSQLRTLSLGSDQVIADLAEELLEAVG